MIKRLLCLLLIFAMIIPLLASCRDKEDPESTDPPTQNNSTNNGSNNNNENNGGNQGSADDNKPTVEDKYPWLERIYRFSAEEFRLAQNEKAGIVAYLMGLGAIAPDADDAAITEVLNVLALNHRHNVQFTSLSAMTVISDDYTYRQDYLYKLDTYKNVVLYSPEDTAMTEKLTAPIYALSLDGKTLTLKVPFSYTTVDGEGTPSTVNCKSYSLITLTRDESIKLSDIPNVVGKEYKLHNFAYRFANEEALADFEEEKGMPLSAWLATENAQITESNSGVLRVEAKNKLVCEKIVGSGIAISEFSYYISIGAGGSVTLYNTEKGRDDKDENDVVTAVSVCFASDGKTAVVSEGTDVQRLRVYTFDKAIEEEIIPGVSGKAYKLSEYTYRFASDSDRVALETAQGKSLDAIIAELNATITEKRYKTLTVTDDGKVVCETVTESGSTVSVFTYFAVVGEDGVMTLYQTAAGRENADASELVTDVAITVTAHGVEIATPIFAGSESVQIEVYQFDKDFEEESVSDPNGNAYLLDGYNYRFDSAEAMEAFEETMGKTVTEVLAEEKAAITSTNGKRVEFANGGSMRLYQVFDRYTVRVLYGFYDIAEDGTVTLYTLPLDREDKTLVDTDLVIRLTSNGVEIAEPFEGGWHIEFYRYEKSAPVYNGVPTVAGSCFVSTSDNEIWYESEKEKDYFDRSGITQSFILDIISQKRSVYLDSYGRIYAMSANGDVEWLYYFTVNDDGSITRYKTEDGRDNGLASDVVKDGNYFFVSPDGSKLEFRQQIASGYGTLAVIHLNFKENVQEETPEFTDKVYLSDTSTPLIWVFDENGVLTAFQNNAILYTYYAKLIAGKVSFYTDPDARDMGDENYLVSSLSADLLLNGSVLLLSNGTTLHYNDAYTKAKTPTLSFGSNVKTEYVEVSNLNIDLSGNVTTNSDGAKIFQWFEGRGMYKSPITSAPKTEGEYTLLVTTMPTANYQTESAEIVITVITYDELVYGATTVSEPPTGSPIRSKTVDVKTGETYVLHVSGCDDYYEDRNEYIDIYLRDLSAPTSFRLFRETNGVIEELEAYLDSDDKVRYKSNGVDTPLAIKQSDTSSYYIVWTASEDQTVTVRYNRTKLM